MDFTWKTEKRKVADLVPADYNPRRMSDKERSDLVESIKRFGEVEPVVINTDNHLIGGHQRVSIYADLGVPEIVVRVPSRKLTDEEEKELNLRLNKNTGGWDFEKLQLFEPNTLLDIGFGNEELSFMWDNVEMNDDDFSEQEAVEEAKKEIRTKLGERWQLGDHTLQCGDATKSEDVAALMGGERADMIYCDPPCPGPKESGEFLQTTIKNALGSAKENVHVFYWCDERKIGVIQQLFADCGIDGKRVCLWIKNNFSLTPQVAFNKAYEPCVYGTRGRPYLNPSVRNLNEILDKSIGVGNKTHSDIMDSFSIWLVSRDSGDTYEHPTQKPVTLHEKPLKRCTQPGSVVLDLFGGSGSTLMACEQLKRKAYIMEIDPVFCTVIINRWEAYAGQTAKKIS